MAKAGRPKIEIDLDKLKGFMRLNPDLKETANFFDCSEDTIDRTIKREFGCNFAEFRDKNAVHTRMGIKRKMIEKAMSGDNTMLIWLSKNLLGMADKIEQKSDVNEKSEVTINISEIHDRISQIKGKK